MIKSADEEEDEYVNENDEDVLDEMLVDVLRMKTIDQNNMDNNMVVDTMNDINEYKWIENTLKKLDKSEWNRYLNNFKKNKITDLRLKHIAFDDKDVWKQLIPEIGVRYEFQQ